MTLNEQPKKEPSPHHPNHNQEQSVQDLNMSLYRNNLCVCATVTTTTTATTGPSISTTTT